jgi:prepilin signal peptidase PulO-like enzyme (type II secretory pathway)
MKEKIFNEISFSVILIILALLFLDPFMLWMPGSMVYALVGGFLVVFAILAGFIWKEKILDERDELHRMFAGRIGYLAGAAVLVLGLVWQSIFSHPDPWIIGALLGMVLGKLIALFYSRKYL